MVPTAPTTPGPPRHAANIERFSHSENRLLLSISHSSSHDKYPSRHCPDSQCKRPVFPSGIGAGVRPMMASWLMQWNLERHVANASGVRLRRSEERRVGKE